VKSHLDREFIRRFRALPRRVQRTARKNYKLWIENPSHPSLEFKRVGSRKQAYSVRVGIGWRALGTMVDDVIVWFWIGSHAEYDEILKLL
jgi:hypothetical protein